MWNTISSYLSENWIAVVALVISVLVFYLDHLRGFNPLFRLGGRVKVTKNPLNLAESALTIDLLTRNRGSRSGVIQNATVILTTPSESLALVAHLVMQDRVLNIGEELPPPEIIPFAGFELGKGDAATTRILMRPRERSFDWELGDYEGIVMVRTSAKDKWVKGPKFSFVVDESDIAELQTIQAVPQPDGRLYINWKTRDKLVGEVEMQYAELEEHVLKSS